MLLDPMHISFHGYDSRQSFSTEQNRRMTSCDTSKETLEEFLTREQSYLPYKQFLFIYLDPILIYISLWINCLFEIRKTAVCFVAGWL